MNNNRMIQIMVFEPGRAPYTTMLEDSLEHRQELVGGDIECIPLPCETVLCCNASGKLQVCRRIDSTGRIPCTELFSSMAIPRKEGAFL